MSQAHPWQAHHDQAVTNLLILKGGNNLRQTEGYRLMGEGVGEIARAIQESSGGGEFLGKVNPRSAARRPGARWIT